MSVVTSILLGLGLLTPPAIMERVFPLGNSSETKQIKSKPDKRAKRNKTRKRYQHFLLPITKQTFKQNQRKELKKSARKKSRK